MVSPGKPLNRGGGHLVAADLALKNDSPLKREAASALRALAAIEKVHSPALLEEIRTRIKRRLRARKKQSAKRQRGRMALKEAVEVEQMQKLRGYHSVPIRN
jgi:hypothetical protein